MVTVVTVVTVITVITVMPGGVVGVFFDCMQWLIKLWIDLQRKRSVGAARLKFFLLLGLNNSTQEKQRLHTLEMGPIPVRIVLGIVPTPLSSRMQGYVYTGHQAIEVQAALALEQFVFCYLCEELLHARAVAVEDGVEHLLVGIPPFGAVAHAARRQRPAKCR